MRFFSFFKQRNHILYYFMARMTFYRKYRSQTFSQMVGQTHIIQTLSNAISNKRLSHAYIFSGPRGTGKTSAARIFAKAVNTFELESQFENLDNALCHRITTGVCVDIVEIDAASNTGVDNIRDLNDKVNFTPVECAYKFYIIDEVHMLSTGAFNALLKTLEEPPSHTIFVLATTEPHKIPITIHSRCQHLRFRNLSDDEIISRLKYVCDQESIQMSDNACAIIAQNSSGCMRDALSLLDQIYSFKGTDIKDDDVVTILGACSIDLINQLVTALFEKNSDNVVTLLNTTFNSGINPLQLLKDLVFTIESVLSFKSGATSLVKYNVDFIQSISKNISVNNIVNLLDCLATIESETRWFSNPSLLMQIKLVQFVLSSNTQVQINSTSQSSPAIQSISKPASNQVDIKPSSSATNPPSNPSTASHPFQKPALHQSQAQKTDVVNDNEGISPVKKGSFSMPTMQPPDTNDVQPQHSSQTNFNQSVSKPESSDPVKLTLEVCSSKWNSFLVKLKSSHTGLFTILRQSTVVSFENNTLELKLFQPVQFFVEKLTEQTYSQLLQEHLNEFYGQKLSFKVYEMSSNSQELSISDSNQEGSTQLQATSTQTSSQEVQNELSLNEIISLFEGKVL